LRGPIHLSLPSVFVFELNIDYTFELKPVAGCVSGKSRRA
jgi:hypothetical protein